MKKIVVLLVTMLLLTANAVAFSEEPSTPTTFDYEGCKKRRYVIEDDMEGIAYIFYGEWDRGETIHTEIEESYEQTGFSSCIYPDILVVNPGTSKQLPVFRIWILYSNDEWLFADNCIIKIGDNRYLFDNIDVKRDSGYTKYVGSWIKETLLIKIGDASIPFMNDLVKAVYDDETITMRLKGSEGYIDFDITYNAYTIASLYEDFLQYGGANEQYLLAIDENIQ